MVIGLKLLSILCWLGAVGMFVFRVYYPFNPELTQDIWDFAYDPVAFVTLTIIVIVNVIHSLNLRNDRRETEALPMDVFTMFTGAIGVLYVTNYVLKFAEGVEANTVIWDIVGPTVAVIMVVSAITYWRRSNEV